MRVPQQVLSIPSPACFVSCSPADNCFSSRSCWCLPALASRALPWLQPAASWGTQGPASRAEGQRQPSLGFWRVDVKCKSLASTCAQSTGRARWLRLGSKRETSS